MRCAACGAAITAPHRTFRHDYDPCNRYKSRRKPVHWCKPCWEAHEAYEIKARQEADERNARLMAEHIRELEK